MKNFTSYALGAVLAIASADTHAIPHRGPISTVSQNKPEIQDQKVCEEQALQITEQVIPELRRRVLSTLSVNLDSLEFKFVPDASGTAAYVQSQVAYYLDGTREEVVLGGMSMNFPNPFLDFSLRYWKKGEYLLKANCKYPQK